MNLRKIYHSRVRRVLLDDLECIALGYIHAYRAQCETFLACNASHSRLPNSSGWLLIAVVTRLPPITRRERQVWLPTVVFTFIIPTRFCTIDPPMSIPHFALFFAASASLLVASSNKAVSTAPDGRCTYRTTDPRMNMSLVEHYRLVSHQLQTKSPRCNPLPHRCASPQPSKSSPMAPIYTQYTT